MRIEANSIGEYLDKLPEDRKAAIEAVRSVILENLPDGYVECLQYGMISYVVPLEVFPKTYNKQPLALLSLANQKNYMSLYMNNIYSDEETQKWFVDEYKKSGKRLDMGKSCVRFRKLDNLPLDLIGKAVAKTSVEEFIEMYRKARG